MVISALITARLRVSLDALDAALDRIDTETIE